MNCASYEWWAIPSRSGPEPLGEPKFEEVAGERDTSTFDPSAPRAMRTDGKQQNWVVDTWTSQKQKKLVNGKTTANVWTGNGLSQNGYGGGREGEGERGGCRGFQWLPAERAQAQCQRCGTNRCGKVFVLIWTRGKVAELGPCIPAETVKVCALIGLHMMAEENALRTVTLLLSWEICARKALFGAAVVMSAQEVRARLLVRITSTTSITSLLKPFSQHGRAMTFEESDVLGEMEWQWMVWMSWPVSILRFLWQFEHGVPSSEWGCSLCSFVCLLVLCKVQEVWRRPHHLSEALWPQSEKDSFPDFRCVHVGKRHRNCLWCAPFICWSVGLFSSWATRLRLKKPLKIKRRSG